MFDGPNSQIVYSKHVQLCTHYTANLLKKFLLNCTQLLLLSRLVMAGIP